MSDIANKLRRLAELRLKEDMLEWSGETDLLQEAADRIAELERQLAERRQPTAQQVEDARDAAPTLKVLSKDEAHLRLHQAINAIKIGNKTDDKLIFRELRKLGVVLAALQAGKEKECGS